MQPALGKVFVAVDRAQLCAEDVFDGVGVGIFEENCEVAVKDVGEAKVERLSRETEMMSFPTKMILCVQLVALLVFGRRKDTIGVLGYVIPKQQ